jgi:hypothetical protein
VWFYSGKLRNAINDFGEIITLERSPNQMTDNPLVKEAQRAADASLSPYRELYLRLAAEVTRLETENAQVGFICSLARERADRADARIAALETGLRFYTIGIHEKLYGPAAELLAAQTPSSEPPK